MNYHQPIDTDKLSENPACNPGCSVCHYKDLDYSSQIHRKEEWARRQLGRWLDRLEPIRRASYEERLGYRAKAWMRPGRDGEFPAFGFFRAVPKVGGKWGKEFVSWRTCPIHLPAIRETADRIARVLAERFPLFLSESLFGIWFGSPDLVLVAHESAPPGLESLVWNKTVISPLERVWFHQTNQVGRTVFGTGPISLIFDRLGNSSFKAEPPVRAFRQIADRLVAEARGEAVTELLKVKPSLVVDLYCGKGDLSLSLPPEVDWLGIESTQAAVISANGLRKEGRRKHLAWTGFVEERLADPRILAEIDGHYALYLNPPRPGLGEKGLTRLLPLIRERPPAVIAYLSCSASSLARDLEAIVGAGFRVERLRPYDFFPQTEHFETLALLHPESE